MIREQPNPGDEKTISMILMDITVFGLSFLKMIYFLRVYKEFGHLIQMLAKCIKDVSVFMVFLTTWISLFAVMLNMLEVEFSDDDYPNLNTFMRTLIQIWRNSVGDISAPVYSRWSQMMESDLSDENKQAMMMIAIIWIIWTLHQFCCLVILLNFLIAIVSQSYEHVMQRMDVFKY